MYQRTGKKEYLDYIKAWLDRFVEPDGSIDRDFDNLDSMLGGNLLVIMHKETGEDRYRVAAEKIRKRLDTYPRTEDRAFWHSENREHQLWLDGAFMVLPFLARFGQAFGDAGYANDETAHQLTIYFGHLREDNGLLRHAYDERREPKWADQATGKSPEFWCRAIGWFGIAHIEVLEVLPQDHPQRGRLIANVRHMASGFERFQDQATGRWFQVVDKGDDADNWTETSCSSMYTYVLSRGVERGYLDAHFTTVADKGYQGVLENVTLGADGRPEIADISIGTNVGDLEHYLGRPRATNDMHGLGAFLIMNEQLMRASQPRLATADQREPFSGQPDLLRAAQLPRPIPRPGIRSRCPPGSGSGPPPPLTVTLVKVTSSASVIVLSPSISANRLLLTWMWRIGASGRPSRTSTDRASLRVNASSEMFRTTGGCIRDAARAQRPVDP